MSSNHVWLDLTFVWRVFFSDNTGKVVVLNHVDWDFLGNIFSSKNHGRQQFSRVREGRNFEDLASMVVVITWTLEDMKVHGTFPVVAGRFKQANVNWWGKFISQNSLGLSIPESGCIWKGFNFNLRVLYLAFIPAPSFNRWSLNLQGFYTFYHLW